ncbi:MAG: efflux RND transporter periplasmic adaptor subunit, partial [Vicinamibacteria bacterium]
MRTRSRFLIGVGILVLAGLAFLGFRSRSGRASYSAVPVDRGEIADVVGATGTLQAVTTVQVGSQ